MFRRRRLGVKIGRKNIAIAEHGHILRHENALALLLGDEDRVIVAAGDEVGYGHIRDSRKQEAVWPIQDCEEYKDVLPDFFNMLVSFAVGYTSLFKPNVVLAIPSNLGLENQRILYECVLDADFNRIAAVPRTLACAAAFNELFSGALVYCGSQSTEAVIIDNQQILTCFTIDSGSTTLDQVIIEYVEATSKLIIGPKTSELTKMNVAAVGKALPEGQATVQGRNRVNGIPDTCTLYADEISKLARVYLTSLVALVRELLTAAPDLQPLIRQQGITLVGGGALLAGIDSYLTEQTGIPIHIPDNPHHVAGIGASRIADSLKWNQVPPNGVFELNRLP